jgi:ABC-2 type transport system permease protein
MTASSIPHLMKKELIQTRRDKRMVAVLLVAPVLQVIVFGFAVNLDLKNQPIVVSDGDRSRESRALVTALAADDSFHITGTIASDDAAEQAVVSGDAVLALLVPRGFADDAARGAGQVMLVVDGSDSNSALRAEQEASQILAQRGLAVARESLQRAFAAKGEDVDGIVPSVDVRARAWFNPAMKTAIFLVPAVFAMVLMVITMVLTSMGLVREKEMGTLEQIMVSPIDPIALMIGKTLPFALIGLVDVTLVVVAAHFVFDVPVRGSLVSLYVASALFLMTTLGLGLFVSTISSTQQQAMLTAFFILLPALMLSGYVFPVENMPEPVQWLTVVDPLRYYVELTRGILVKGASLADLWHQAVALAGLGLAVLIGAASLFHKRLA